ncbi:hypothetical protein Taro_017989 [Colocasia esculenta]|uniref:SKP1-like protein n=1 Tax=Colocasia esculenta TaxID=4460 RepID=A0A843UQ90_COLES|nr:hypothetical protein [Colocasia esculenta]
MSSGDSGPSSSKQLVQQPAAAGRSPNQPPLLGAGGRKVIVLKSGDEEEFEVDLLDAMQSRTLRRAIEDGCGDGPMPLPNLTGPVLAKVVELFRRHRGDPRWADELQETEKEGMFKDYAPQKPTAEVKGFDREFVSVDRDALFDLLRAANFLEAPGLLDVTCDAAADAVMNMTVEEVREYFGLVNDYTPEEEAALRKQHEWAFQ